MMTITDTCIAANLDHLDLRLMQSRNLVCIARAALKDGKRNLAIGTVLPLETMLPELQALFSTVLLLHRSARHHEDLITDEVQS